MGLKTPSPPLPLELSFSPGQQAAASLSGVLLLLLVPSLSSLGVRVFSHGLLSFCAWIDWERRPFPPCALGAFVFVQFGTSHEHFMMDFFISVCVSMMNEFVVVL